MRIDTYLIEMADRKHDIEDCYQDILAAFQYVCLSVCSRYGVQMQHPLMNGGKLYMDIKIPDSLPSDFESEKFLWRIPEYMVSTWGAKYRGMLIGDNPLVFQKVQQQYKTNQSVLLSG